MFRKSSLIALAAATATTAAVAAPAAHAASTTDVVKVTASIPATSFATVEFNDVVDMSGNTFSTATTGPINADLDNMGLVMKASDAPVTYSQTLNVVPGADGTIDGTAKLPTGASATISVNGGPATPVNGAFSIPGASAGLGATSSSEPQIPMVINHKVKVAPGKLAKGRTVPVTARVTNPDPSVKNWWSNATINKVVRTGVNNGYEKPYRVDGYRCVPTVKGNKASFKCFLRGGDVPTQVRLTFTANYA